MSEFSAREGLAVEATERDLWVAVLGKPAQKQVQHFNDDDLYIYRAATNEMVEQIGSGSPRCRAVKYGQERLPDGLAWVPGMTAKRIPLWSRSSAAPVDAPEPDAPALTFSEDAKKKLGVYMRRMTQAELSGYHNSYTRMQLNGAAMQALHQILLDNTELTGYGAALDEIGREMTS